MKQRSPASAGGSAKGCKIRLVPGRRVRALGCICLLAAVVVSTDAQEIDAVAALDRTVAAAEESLRIGELQIAESRYRTALLQGWMILGATSSSAGRLPDARRAFERAAASAVENTPALHSLAIVQLQSGNAASALGILTRMATASPSDVAIRRTLAQALAALGKPAEAVQELEEARGIAPVDPELAFALGSGYLRLKRLDAAERLFGEVAAARPFPQTYVLIGRTYRDQHYYDRARHALRRALEMDPRTPRAHYYLATTALMEEGVVRVDEAIAEFYRELKITPGDPPATLRLGMALVEARRYEEAMPHLKAAARDSSGSAELLVYLGRCQLGLGQAAEAVISLRKALEALGSTEKSLSATEQARRRSIHYQLATALRATGASAEAEREFAEAKRLAAGRAQTEREELTRYVTDTQDPDRSNPHLPPLDIHGSATPAAPEHAAVDAHVRIALARAYLNLGIVHAQAKRFARAADLFEQAAEVDPAFPQVQYSLGVAYFNAHQYDKATGPLTRALEQDSKNADVKRMLALASLNAEDYAKAAELLRGDPQLPSNPSLQYAFGLALVRSDRAQEAEQIFSRVLAEHPDVPELNVVVGQAHAAQGDYAAAVAALQRAIELKRDVADAHAALGVIYLKQGKLSEAASALRSELASYPNNLEARHALATTLDLNGESDAALAELRAVVAAKPRDPDAQYLFGKILLARGSAAEAAAHLEIAARAAPDDANVRYQLGQAYQRLGRTELAAREFETYKKLKDKHRGGKL
jgi:tetratricopeptide (TPR) repeat protein